MAEFKDLDELKAWLEGQPRAVSMVIAARAALRVLPLLAAEFSESKHELNRDAGDIVLPVFHAMAVSWAAGKYPAHGMELAARYAAEAAFIAAGTATNIVALDAATAAQAAASAVFADDASTILAAFSAAEAFADASDAAGTWDEAALAPNDSWKAVSADATRIENGMAPDVLAGKALWDNETPDWAVNSQNELEYRLVELNPDWVVWTGWYDARLKGRLTYPRGTVKKNEKIEIARATIDDAIWKEGPAAVFAEIRRLGKEILGREPPVEPDSGLGPDYALKAGKLAAVAHLPQEAESEQSSNLHKQLRKKAKDFSRVIGPAANEYPELAEAATEYTKLVDVPTDQLDVVAVWSVGGALAAFSRSYREQNESRTMASPLEPQLAAKLASLVRDHGAFIIGFEEGRDLVERADRFALDADVIREIETPGNTLLNELTDNSALVDEDTRKVHEPVRDAAVEFGWKTSRVGYSAYVIVRKAVYAMIKIIFREGRSPAEIVAILAGTPIAISALAGDPNVEFIRVAVPVLREHGAHLLSFFNHSPEFRAYVEWALHVLEDDDEAKTKE